MPLVSLGDFNHAGQPHGHANFMPSLADPALHRKVEGPRP
jgi:hypothetical protein